MTEPDEWLDERGRPCPLPVTALARAARRLPPGAVLGLLADDAAAEFDVPAWCRMRGAELLEVRREEAVLAFVIRLPGTVPG